ncbi:MAG: restriction endonuclease subunit S [Selenomonadaceae bacterium]|nr:restriction endonuclease subunit S [Selenomonadaceae bacterium]
MERFGDKVQCNPSVKLKKGNSYPLVSIDKIVVGYKSVVSDEFITYTGQSGCKFQDNDVLMARITPCLENGKIAVAKTDGEKGIGSTELFVFRGIDNVSDTNYIYYLLCMPYMRGMAINSMTGASGRQRADIGFIKKIPWTYPSLEMQQRIVDILSHYDNLIENNNKRIKILEQMAENLYKEWFVRFRFPGYETAEFVDGLPKNWNHDRLESFYNTSSGGTPSRNNESYYIGGTIPWIKTGEIKDTIIINTDEYITEKALKASSAKLFPSDTVIMAMYGVNIGKLGYLGNNMACNQAACVFWEKSNIKSKHYLFQLLKSMREYFLNIGFGAAQQNLSQQLINSIKVVMPEEFVLKQFEDAIEPMYQVVKKLKVQNIKLSKQRDLLLPRLMSGKLQVK